MLLDTLVIIGSLEQAIGNSVRISLSSYGSRDGQFASGLKLTAEWLVERELIRLQHVIPASDLERVKDIKEFEKMLLVGFVEKAKQGYKQKLYEIRTRIEKEIRNAAKA